MFPPSPLQRIAHPLFSYAQVKVWVKRDDLIHPHIQGNKWRKLKENISEAQRVNANTLLTFGGRFSNHIYATAATAKLFNFRSIGVIRGEEPDVYSSTLQFAKQQGMKLVFVSRTAYAQKTDPFFIDSLKAQYGLFYLLPEGGTNELALKGVESVIEEIKQGFDYICTPCGTGGTLAGLVSGLKGKHKVLGFSVLKGEDKLTESVHQLTRSYMGTEFENFEINFDYHFGGYAKTDTELLNFIDEFYRDTGIPTEPVYTGKMFYGLLDKIKTGYFPTGSRIVVLHTGGLQHSKFLNDITNKQ